MYYQDNNDQIIVGLKLSQTEGFVGSWAAELSDQGYGPTYSDNGKKGTFSCPSNAFELAGGSYLANA